jgi:histidinol-phosphate aminotransferase
MPSTFSNRFASSSVTRRSFLRSASALATLPIMTEAHLAHAASYAASVPQYQENGIHIDANENPLGPCEAARKAIIDIVPNGGRYAMSLYTDLMKLFAEQAGVPVDHVALYDGSSPPLQFATMAFTSPTRSLVQAYPTYEAAGYAARATKAPIHEIPLADDCSHDVKAMLAADKNPGIIYICNPNNPTGTTTSKEQIDYAVANKPAGTVILVDEAYIHLSDATSAMDHVKAGKDVIILRTFSKIYGMAGIRCGVAVAKPELLKKLMDYGQLPLPITGLIAAKASLLDTELVPKRKKMIADVRNDTFAWLKQNNYSFIPSESNCFMIDVKRKPELIRAAMAQDGVFIGRSWPAMRTSVRITVGLPSEMEAFKTSFKKAMDAPVLPAAAFNETLRQPHRYFNS